jgi:hypothetical protein
MTRYRDDYALKDLVIGTKTNGSWEYEIIHRPEENFTPSHLMLKLDEDGNPNLIWKNVTRVDDIYFAEKIDGVWDVHCVALNGFGPSLSLLGDDVYISSVCALNRYKPILFRRIDGHWSAHSIVFDQSWVQMTDLQTPQDGRMYIVHSDALTSPSLIALSTWDGRNWVKQDIEGSVNTNGMQVVRTSPSGSPIVGYRSSGAHIAFYENNEMKNEVVSQSYSYYLDLIVDENGYVTVFAPAIEEETGHRHLHELVRSVPIP